MACYDVIVVPLSAWEWGGERIRQLEEDCDSLRETNRQLEIENDALNAKQQHACCLLPKHRLYLEMFSPCPAMVIDRLKRSSRYG